MIKPVCRQIKVILYILKARGGFVNPIFEQFEYRFRGGTIIWLMRTVSATALVFRRFRLFSPLHNKLYGPQYSLLFSISYLEIVQKNYKKELTKIKEENNL
jgi:hypothetical protein